MSPLHSQITRATLITLQTYALFVRLSSGSNIYGQLNSLQLYNLTDASVSTIISKPNASYYGWTNAGFGCYDAENDRIYYMGEGADDGNWQKYAIYGFALKDNTVLAPIIVTKYFAPVSPFPHIVLESNLLFCNPKTGELFIWGLSPKLNSEEYVLYNIHDITYSDNNMEVSFQITLIGNYKLGATGCGFADMAHIFDTKRNAIWFTDNYNYSSTYYYICCDNGTISQIEKDYGGRLTTGVYYEEMDIIVTVQWNNMLHQLKMMHINPVSFDIIKEFNWIQFPNAIDMGIPCAIDNGIFYEMGFGQNYAPIYGLDIQTNNIIINVSFEGDWQTVQTDDLFVIP